MQHKMDHAVVIYICVCRGHLKGVFLLVALTFNSVLSLTCCNENKDRAHILDHAVILPVHMCVCRGFALTLNSALPKIYMYM